jgi:3-hydroxybutyryl-CoA dehydrogenase
MTTVAIIGSGQMGAGIAQVAAQAGETVLLWNRKVESVEKGLALVQRGLDRLLKRETITAEQHRAARERVRGVTALEDVKGADWVLESVPEDLELKRQIWERLGRLCADSAIFASNTSSLSITALAQMSGRPQRFVGLHFFNPAPIMKLVEVVSGEQTSEEVVAAAALFAERLGKVPIKVRDFPGFVVNRVVMPMINEAANALMQGVASAQSIDECMKLGCNHPMGPLALADLVGLDVVHAILDALYREFGSPHYKPCPLITKKVEAGLLGTKTGRGFYSY